MWSNRTALVLIFGFAVLAIFIALMADVSILLARRANLRRAVETAAVAVAGQVYGGTDTQSASLTAANLIEVQGFDPQNVLVETCETDIARWQEANPAVSVPPDTPISAVMPPTELCLALRRFGALPDQLLAHLLAAFELAVIIGERMLAIEALGADHQSDDNVGQLVFELAAVSI
jgi:hypothetical protein